MSPHATPPLARARHILTSRALCAAITVTLLLATPCGGPAKPAAPSPAPPPAHLDTSLSPDERASLLLAQMDLA